MSEYYDIGAYKRLQTNLLSDLNDEVVSLESTVPQLQASLLQAQNKIIDLDRQIGDLDHNLNRITQLVNSADYAEEVAANLTKIRLRKGIVAQINSLTNEPNVETALIENENELAPSYAESIDPSDEEYGFTDGSVWFIAINT